MNPNPYDPPNTPQEPSTNIVDRTQRVELSAVVRRFLDESTTAFEFDEQLNDYRSSTDSAVRFVAQAVWFHYDDCEDHRVTLSKPEWDYFQRMLLLLESDRVVKTINNRQWSISQLIAFVALFGFILLAFQLGWGYHLLVVAIPFGIISVGISWSRRRTAEFGPYERILFPFATFSELKSTYEAVTFTKSHYPRHIETRRIRSPAMNAYLHIQFHAIWLVLSPIALVFQMLPQMRNKTSVVTA